jgi:hypothetical protein
MTSPQPIPGLDWAQPAGAQDDAPHVQDRFVGPGVNPGGPAPAPSQPDGLDWTANVRLRRKLRPDGWTEPGEVG